MTINWRENFVEVWDQIKRQGEQEGFKDKELQEMFRPYLVKDGLSTNQIRYLFNAEEYKDRSKEQHTRNKSANIPQIDVKKDTEQKDIEKIGEIRRAEEKREVEEEPTPEELALITEQQTQTIQKKTSDVQSLIENNILTEENIFEWLAKRDNKVSNFYFGNCGIEFFTRQVFGNLKGSGIKIFKRLYFEV